MYIIVNPVAGKGRCKQACMVFFALLKKQRIAFEHDLTQYPGHATELARAAVKNGCKRIVVMGGDGTVHEVSTALANTDTVLCIYPAGSGNDLARVLGLPNTPELILDMIMAAHVAAIDTGLINGAFFCNVAGFGFDVEVIRQVNKLKKLRGSLAYVIAVFRAISVMRFHHVRLTMDDMAWEGNALLIAVCNGQYFGGGMRVSPLSNLQDGLFHVTIIHRVPRWWVPFLLPRFINGTHVKLRVCTTKICKSVVLESDDADEFQLDGQLSGQTPAAFQVVPASLKVFVPRSSDLVFLSADMA